MTQDYDSLLFLEQLNSRLSFHFTLSFFPTKVTFLDTDLHLGKFNFHTCDYISVISRCLQLSSTKCSAHSLIPSLIQHLCSSALPAYYQHCLLLSLNHCLTLWSPYLQRELFAIISFPSHNPSTCQNIFLILASSFATILVTSTVAKSVLYT